jgi:hypothetical protein
MFGINDFDDGLLFDDLAECKNKVKTEEELNKLQTQEDLT